MQNEQEPSRKRQFMDRCNPGDYSIANCRIIQRYGATSEMSSQKIIMVGLEEHGKKPAPLALKELWPGCRLTYFFFNNFNLFVPRGKPAVIGFQRRSGFRCVSKCDCRSQRSFPYRPTACRLLPCDSMGLQQTDRLLH